MQSHDWYCRINDEEIGPVSSRALRSMAAVGELIPSDEVRNGPDGTWQPAHTLKGLEFASTTRKSKLPSAQTSSGGGSPSYVYKMVQVLPNIVVQEKDHRGHEAAAYLENLVNEYPRDSWEFHRVDTIGVKILPGCLLQLLFQQGPTIEQYYVVTFRRVRDR